MVNNEKWLTLMPDTNYNPSYISDKLIMAHVSQHIKCNKQARHLQIPLKYKTLEIEILSTSETQG